MKALKLDHQLAQDILNGNKRSTWRLFDDKDLSVNDKVILIDKVDTHHRDTWVPVGEAIIERVTQKRLGDITQEDYQGHETYKSPEQMMHMFQRYYGPGVSLQTPVKIIFFSFTPFAKESAQQRLTESATKISNPRHAKLYADGGSRGNPGPSASGVVLVDRDNNLLLEKGVFLGVTTNNQAEYTALKLGLEEARGLGIEELEVFMDSMLVVNQMKGVFKVKNRDLWPIHEAIKQHLQYFKKVTFTHIPRELNKAADAAVNRALDDEIAEGELRKVL